MTSHSIKYVPLSFRMPSISDTALKMYERGSVSTCGRVMLLC